MDVLENLYQFYLEFDGKKGFIGKTEQGVLIPYFFVGKSAAPILICQYAIHAREYITTYLAIEQIKRLKDKKLNGGVYFIPAVNIDGIKIALNKNPLYKANASGVDLNVNFDAKWGCGAKNVRQKGDENFIGTKPFSESESRALRDFTLKIKPDMTISYHSKGEEIYWHFFQEETEKERDYLLAKTVSKITGYSVKYTPNSCGGYKDWCIEKLKIPALTIEVGDDNLTHPIGVEHLDKIVEKNEGVIETLLKKLKETK